MHSRCLALAAVLVAAHSGLQGRVQMMVLMMTTIQHHWKTMTLMMGMRMMGRPFHPMMIVVT